jgi:hypothetical protein
MPDFSFKKCVERLGNGIRNVSGKEEINNGVVVTAVRLIEKKTMKKGSMVLKFKDVSTVFLKVMMLCILGLRAWGGSSPQISVTNPDIVFYAHLFPGKGIDLGSPPSDYPQNESSYFRISRGIQDFWGEFPSPSPTKYPSMKSV